MFFSIDSQMVKNFQNRSRAVGFPEVEMLMLATGLF